MLNLGIFGRRVSYISLMLEAWNRLEIYVKIITLDGCNLPLGVRYVRKYIFTLIKSHVITPAFMIYYSYLTVFHISTWICCGDVTRTVNFGDHFSRSEGQLWDYDVSSCAVKSPVVQSPQRVAISSHLDSNQKEKRSQGAISISPGTQERICGARDVGILVRDIVKNSKSWSLGSKIRSKSKTYITRDSHAVHIARRLLWSIVRATISTAEGRYQPLPDIYINIAPHVSPSTIRRRLGEQRIQKW